MKNISEAAKALGRLGGLKGGKARALKLTPEERTAIAKKAAAKRWAKKQSSPSQEEAPILELEEMKS
jgi:hypothetical protein